MTLEKLQSAAQTARNLPRLSILRLATATGVSAGWWIMAICSAVVGAVVAVVVVTVVHSVLNHREAVAIESATSDGIEGSIDSAESTDGD